MDQVGPATAARTRVNGGAGAPTTGFRYERGRLTAGGVDIAAALAKVGSHWAYDAERIDANLDGLTRAFTEPWARVCYAIKANSNPAILKRVRARGVGAEVGSGGELELALGAGFDPAGMVVNGNGKTATELDRAVRAGVGLISADSPAELDRIEVAGAAAGRVQPVLLRFNPDVDPHTHPYIATGLKESKFGMTPVEALAACAVARARKHVAIVGLHVHVGSQILELGPLEAALKEAVEIALAGRAAGAPLEIVDLGGGLGIDYEGDGSCFALDEYGRLVRSILEPAGLAAIVEPGRFVVGDAGALVGRVLEIKRGPARTFVVLDVGMNDLLRPALYDAHHRIVPLVEPEPAAAARDAFTADVVGPICESGDLLARARTLPPLAVGDGVAVLDAGAYGYTMSSNYNGRPRLPEVLLEDGAMRLVRKGEQAADLARLAVDEPLSA
jgi:diaminopimelate decarboxylase